MQKKVWLDGTMVSWQDATIHITTHTLHYGSGAFEGIRCYLTEDGPAIFRLSDHVKRLLHSCASFGVKIPWTHTLLEQAVIETIQANKLSNCYIRPIIFFGSESLLISPRNCSIHCAIIAQAMDKYLATNGVNVCISKIKRMNPDCAHLENKINGYYVNSIFAFHDAQDRGFDEALLLDSDNNIAEGSVANIFFVINGILTTPPVGTILPGITRDSAMTLAQELQIPVEERVICLNDIEHASEAFFTGTASEITPIKKIDSYQFLHTPGPITQKIASTYHSIIRGRNQNYKKWLTLIS